MARLTVCGENYGQPDPAADARNGEPLTLCPEQLRNSRPVVVRGREHLTSRVAAGRRP
jgi:hypothetical protein